MASLVPQFTPAEEKGNGRIRADQIRSGRLTGRYQLTGNILVTKDTSNSASGYIAFGTSMSTIPTSSSAGSGVYIDYTGIYGLASGTKQFYLQASDGKAYAGAGAVQLDANGITITDTPSSQNRIRFIDNVEGRLGELVGGDDEIWIHGYKNGSTYYPFKFSFGTDETGDVATAVIRNTGVFLNSTLVCTSAESFTSVNSTFEILSHTNYVASGWQHLTAKVQTTDNTITTLYTKTLTDNTVYQYNVRITARRSDTGTENGIYWRRFGVYRQGAGAATLIAAADTIGADAATTLAGTITVDVNSNDVRVRVTGEVGKTVLWVATVEWQAVSTTT